MILAKTQTGICSQPFEDAHDSPLDTKAHP
jgi:hypothetical protein